MHALVRTHLTAWLCFVAYLLAGVSSVEGLVLCVGPSGHVAIEAAAAPGDCGGCALDQERGPSEAPADVERSPECPCDDVQLPSAGRLAQKSSSNRWADPCLQALPAIPVALDWVDSPRLALRARHRVAEATRASRTRPLSVVLLV
ncbi:MAG: hypothetical protein K8S98_16695 [Planctomycetes bacterium]|nr:hypothetical protein [Planctomycetota bacterium]